MLIATDARRFTAGAVESDHIDGICEEVARLALAASTQKRLESVQGRIRNVMLNSLGVGFRRLPRRADRNEQVDDEPVTLTHAIGHSDASLGQEYTTIGTRCREPFAF